MSDNEIDPCECMWNNLAVQHLLSIIRRTQDYCSDTECYSITGLPEPQMLIRESSDFYFTCIMITVVVFLYVMQIRPRWNFRQNPEYMIKNNNEPNSQNGPPSPPTAN